MFEILTNDSSFLKDTFNEAMQWLMLKAREYDTVTWNECTEDTNGFDDLLAFRTPNGTFYKLRKYN